MTNPVINFISLSQSVPRWALHITDESFFIPMQWIPKILLVDFLFCINYTKLIFLYFLVLPELLPEPNHSPFFSLEHIQRQSCLSFIVLNTVEFYAIQPFITITELYNWKCVHIICKQNLRLLLIITLRSDPSSSFLSEHTGQPHIQLLRQKPKAVSLTSHCLNVLYPFIQQVL